MRKRILLLINVISGKGNGSQKLLSIISNLAVRDCEITVYPIDPINNLGAEHIIKYCENRFDVIVCCGGDGTYNHMINALMNVNSKVSIGYIPNGSTNDFAKNLYGTYSLEKLCDIIANGKEFVYDIGEMNGHYFNYVAGFGAFAEVSYSTSQNVKNILGYGAYVLNMIKSLPQSLAYHVHASIAYDGCTEEGDYIFCGVTNSLQVAGVKTPMLENVALDDGIFEVLLIKAPKNVAEINKIIRALTSENVDAEYVKIIKASDIIFKTERAVEWTLDGEYGGKMDCAHIKVCKQAMTILI